MPVNLESRRRLTQISIAGERLVLPLVALPCRPPYPSTVRAPADPPPSSRRRGFGTAGHMIVSQGMGESRCQSRWPVPARTARSEEHPSDLQSLLHSSYAVLSPQNKKQQIRDSDRRDRNHSH